MAARETKPNGKSQLIRDLKNGEFATLYIISGEESYMKEYYLRQLRQKVVDETFADFNLIEFEGKGLTPEMLTEAIDSYPAMADKKLMALLQALSSAGGSYVSGQQLAETLGVSRAAVHKAAAALTAQGYALEAAPRRGYRLAGGDPFCAEAIGDYPAPIYLYDTLESSNRTAKLLALDGAPHGTLVLTAHQSAGRGRLGRRFESPAGKGVYCSVLLRPEMPAANAQTATISAAVAVCRAVKKLCGLELAIKWVNDLYYQGRKVCGILTEAGTDLESGQLEWLVVGIGLNLTSTAADWPEELARRAGSLYPGGPAPVSRAALAGAIARELLALCPGFDCLDEYRARCFVPGHWVTVCAETETYAAKALAIDEEGRLVIQRENGRQEALRCGEVTTRPARTE